MTDAASPAASPVASCADMCAARYAESGAIERLLLLYFASSIH